MLTEILLRDLLHSMKHGATPPEIYPPGDRLRFETPAGTQVFTALPGRRAERYLQVETQRLNRHHLYSDALPFTEIEACPPPYNIFYGDALKAHRQGDTDRVQALTEEFNRNRNGQLSMLNHDQIENMQTTIRKDK